MTDVHRLPSRRQRLNQAFLSQKLQGAKPYRRIAGYCRSSIFELVGKEISTIAQVQVVCNSELDATDFLISKHVRETALKER
jgi:hypothetical protein